MGALRSRRRVRPGKSDTTRSSPASLLSAISLVFCARKSNRSPFLIMDPSTRDLAKRPLDDADADASNDRAPKAPKPSVEIFHPHQPLLRRAIDMPIQYLLRLIVHFDDESILTARSPLKTMPESIPHGASVVLALHPAVKAGLVNGDLLLRPKAVRQLPPVARAPIKAPGMPGRKPADDKSALKDSRPLIYGHFHVDGQGRPPTRLEYERIMATVRLYLDSEKAPAPLDEEMKKACAWIDGYQTVGKKTWQASSTLR